MKSSIKSTLACLFSTALISIFITACSGGSDPGTADANPDLPVERIRGLTTLYSDSGKVTVRVNAPVYEKIRKEQVFTRLPEGIRIEFFDENLRVESQLTAGWALHRENERVWEARKDVVVVNQKGERLDTQHLIWDERKELLTSEEDVKITTAEEVIFGKGFEADQDFSRYRIFNVRGRITLTD
ncbi:MAG: LPS export ABC transporter periplasmic protein LptC [Sphingobacteriales bacterium]|nr:LPS export ABC transporter periplasmic protein LptC [Sphingobacteriales bacterium]